MRQTKKVKTKFYSRIPFIRPRQENSEKNSKKIQKIIKPFPDNRPYFQPNGAEKDRKSENKILVSNSVHTRPGQENSEKNSKKIQKIIKPLPGIIFCPNGITKAKKVKTKFYSRIPFILDPGRKILKKIVKKFKNYKTFSRNFFQTKRDEIG